MIRIGQRRMAMNYTADGVPSDYKRMQIQTAKSTKTVRQSIPIYAIIGTWNEADIIGATIQHLKSQGVARVYVVDNDSTDDTVDVSIASGATVVETYRTRIYEEHTRLAKINQHIARINQQENLPTLWWLAQDADEFVHGPNGQTISEYMSSLSETFMTVGAVYFDHYPSAASCGEYPAYESRSGLDPIQFQPLAVRRDVVLDSCTRYPGWVCEQKHWKHHLTKYRAGEPAFAYHRGMHMIWSQTGGTVYEPQDALITHHYPFREKAVTAFRLRGLCEPDALGQIREDKDNDVSRGTGTIKRLRNLEKVYNGEYGQIEVPHDFSAVGVALRPWYELL